MDLSDKISVLSINTLYYDSERTKKDPSMNGVDQMFWLAEQLKHAEEGRKFIIIQHVYGGARYYHPMWNTYPNETYFELLAEHKDKIIMEVGGHDHFTSLRYHTSSDILAVGDGDNEGSDDTLFHNILVNPSITPWYFNNPGVSSFEIDETSLLPHNYQASYLNLAPTLGKDATMPPYDELEWRDIDFQAEFGLEDLTAQGIHKLRLKL